MVSSLTMVTVLDYDEKGQLVPADKPTAMAFPEDQPNLFLYHRLQGCDQIGEKETVGLHTRWCYAPAFPSTDQPALRDQRQVSLPKKLWQTP